MKSICTNIGFVSTKLPSKNCLKKKSSTQTSKEILLKILYFLFFSYNKILIPNVYQHKTRPIHTTNLKYKKKTIKQKKKQIPSIQINSPNSNN